jgi:hypothetical protein
MRLGDAARECWNARPHPFGENGKDAMRNIQRLLPPLAPLWLTGCESQSLNECLAETTVDCAMDQAVAAARASRHHGVRPRDCPPNQIGID